MNLSAIAKLNQIPVVPIGKSRQENRQVNIDSVFDSLLLGSKQQNFQLAHLTARFTDFEKKTDCFAV